jgi:GntR family transcriptional regulator
MTAMLDPEVTLQGGMAIALQIRTQVRDLIAAGALATGEQLPTVRSLAVELAVNPAAVREAYTELEQEGFLTSGEGSGTFVAALPPESGGKASFRDEVERLCMTCLSEAARYGYTSADVVNLMQNLALGGTPT